MSDLTIKMQELVKRCQAILDAMFSREPRSASPKTQVEYERQAPDGHPNSPAYGHLKLPHLN